MSLDLSVLSHKLASNTSKKEFHETYTSSSIYDHCVMRHVKFNEDVIGFREVIAL